MLGLGQPARSFWQLPPGTPEWMRPPDWMALGSPGKIVGITWNPRRRQYEMVEAAAGLGSPGKIVGYNPDTGEIYYAMAGGVGQIPAAAQAAAQKAAEAAAAAARAQAQARMTTAPTSAQVAAQKAAEAAARAQAQARMTTAPKAPAKAKAGPPIGLIVLGVGVAALAVGVLVSRRRQAQN
jgi:hypothetical protein